jgi:hypothetical protein
MSAPGWSRRWRIIRMAAGVGVIALILATVACGSLTTSSSGGATSAGQTRYLQVMGADLASSP